MAVKEIVTPQSTSSASTSAKWAYFGGLIFVAIIVVASLLVCRITSGPKIYDDNTLAVEPLWGITYWPRIFEVGCTIGTIIMWTILIRQSIKLGKLTPVAVLMASTTLLCWLDPPGNWVGYVVYDKSALHFPETMPWAAIAPSVEPLAVWVGYSWFFILPGLVAIAIYRRWAAKKAAGHFIRRRPLTTIFLLAWAICIPWDAAVEMALVRLPLYTYAQVVPWLSVFAGKWYQFPILIESTTFGFVLALAAPLMWRDDTGTTINDRISQKTPLLGRWPNAGPVIVSLAILSVAYLAYDMPYTVIRSTGVATAPAQPWPYSKQAVYDPQGYYDKTGQPGRKYEGTWGGWEMRR